MKWFDYLIKTPVAQRFDGLKIVCAGHWANKFMRVK